MRMIVLAHVSVYQTDSELLTCCGSQVLAAVGFEVSGSHNPAHVRVEQHDVCEQVRHDARGVSMTRCPWSQRDTMLVESA